jgi:hypothetical protein
MVFDDVTHGVEKKYRTFNPEKIIGFEFVYNPNSKNDWIDINKQLLRDNYDRVYGIVLRTDPIDAEQLEENKYFQKGLLFLRSKGYLKDARSERIWQGFMSTRQLAVTEMDGIVSLLNDHLDDIQDSKLRILDR